MSRTAAAQASVLWRLGATPNQVTVGALIIGLGASVVIGFGSFRLGLALWLASRVLDGYDGMLARLSAQESLLGGFLDISCDMLAYSAMAVGFAVAMPQDRVAWLLVLVGYIMAITTTLALSSLLERADRQLGGDRSLQFTPALAEGGETTIAYSLVALWPGASRQWLVLWLLLLGASLAQRARLADRKSVV